MMTTASSPMQQRRDSILKHQGSVKTDKRVSIKQTNSTSNSNTNNNNNNSAKMSSNIEYISERQNDSTSSNRNRLTTKPPSGPRPASLIITKSDMTPQFKLLRSSSVDYDDIEGQHNATMNAIKATLLEQQEDESAPLVFTARK